MAQHDRSGFNAQRPQRQPGTEGDVIHDDAVGLHLVHDLGQPVEHPVGFVEQVVAASVRLMEQRRDRTDPGRLEERAQVLVLARRLLADLDDPCVAARAETQRDPRETRLLDHRAGRFTRRHDRFAARSRPRRGDLDHGTCV